MEENVRFLLDKMENFFLSLGISDFWTSFLNAAIIFLLILTVSFLCFFAVNYCMRYLVRKTEKKVQYTFVDLLKKRRVLNNIGYLVVLIVFYVVEPLVLESFARWSVFLHKLIYIGIVWVTVRIITSMLWFFVDLNVKKNKYHNKPYKGLVQFANIIVYVVAVILVVADLINRSPLVLIGGLSAASAVLMLIFKDTLLGLVAGVQLAYNDMVRVGDWITMPSYNADGDVVDIALTTVKVQNFDKTITTIPAYNLISSSVINWRAMQDEGVRRIRRSIYIDLSSIHFCTPEMLEKFGQVELLRPHIAKKLAGVDDYATVPHCVENDKLEGLSLTNIGMFRAYILAYLKHRTDVAQDKTLMVRQLESDDTGMPLQIYCFAATSDWSLYEEIQSNIFDHLYAAIPFFGLRIYERSAQFDDRAS